MNYYDNFISKYNIRDLNIDEEYKSIDIDKYGYSYNQLTQQPYYAPRYVTSQICTVKIERQSLEHLMENDKRHEELVFEQRKEEYIRYNKPAVKAAYDKYKLLLEMYRD
jgi:hypothetical protein